MRLILAACAGGCDGAASCTPTPTQNPNVTPTVFIPGCNNGSFDVELTNASAGNMVTDPLTLSLVAGAQVRDPRSGFYLWGITGLECTGNQPTFHRAVQMQYLGAPSAFAPGTYTLTPPLSYFIYQELQDNNVYLRAWDTTSATLTIEEVDGSSLRFRITATMKPQPLLSFGQTPQGTFDLEVTGTVNNFTSQ